MAYENHLIDKRIVERNIAKGLVDSAEYKRINEALPDREANLVHVSLDGDSGASASAAASHDVEDDLDDDDLDDEDDEEDEDEGDDKQD